MQGKVFVDDFVVTKPGTAVAQDEKISYSIEGPKYVSRAGFLVRMPGLFAKFLDFIPFF